MIKNIVYQWKAIVSDQIEVNCCTYLAELYCLIFMNISLEDETIFTF